MKNRCWKIFGLVGLMALSTLNVSMAAEVKGKITKVSAKTVTATLTQQSMARIGNEATIALWIEGVGEIPIKGTWLVKSVSGSKAVLMPRSDDNAQPLVGQRVTIANTDHIVATPTPSKPPPRKKPVSQPNIRYIQERLITLGYKAGSTDGAMGPRTRQAIRDYQSDNGLHIDGRASIALQKSLKTGKKKRITLLDRDAPVIPLSGVGDIDNRPSDVIMQEADDYYFGMNGKQLNYGKSLELNRIVAERGHPDALYDVGVAYAFGNGITKDINIARGYFQQSAAKGNSRAAFNMAAIYKKGLGVKKDYNIAMGYMLDAVKGGDVETYYGMGNFYYLGIGVKASREQAVFWYLKGARADDKNCQEQLKKMGIKW